jgi:hypothetical protein
MDSPYYLSSLTHKPKGASNVRAFVNCSDRLLIRLIISGRRVSTLEWCVGKGFFLPATATKLFEVHVCEGRIRWGREGASVTVLIGGTQKASGGSEQMLISGATLPDLGTAGREQKSYFDADGLVQLMKFTINAGRFQESINRSFINLVGGEGSPKRAAVSYRIITT